MKKQILIIFAVAAAQFLSCAKESETPVTPSPSPSPSPTPESPSGYEVGEVLHDWEKGCLDFHGISTGRGECWLLILPDGTSVLIDAGETPGGESSVPQRPSDATAPHVTIQKYLQHFLPATLSSELDYMFLTHFHVDHMSGMSAVYEAVPCKKLIDRGWPDYGSNPDIGYYDMSSSGSTSTDTPNWIKFAQSVNAKGIPVECFSVGSTQQFAMTKGGGHDCSVKNIVGNGHYVTSSGTVSSQSVAGENPCSCGIHVRYGKFDLITCGDLTSGPQNRVASYVTGTVPGKSLEVFKAHHHLNSNSWGSGMSVDDFSPKVVLAESFTRTDDSHITTNIIGKATSKSDAVFLTNAHPESVAAYPSAYGALKGYDGHFVVRVFADGTFYVYKLSDRNFEYRIAAKYGPYTSK